MTTSDPQRAGEARSIQAAAERLLAGTPQRSSGRLSVVSLAAEAGLNRTKLYDHHRALVDDFLQRAGTHPTAHHADTAAELAAARARINELEQLAASQQAQLQSLRAALVELTLSNANPKSHAIHLVRGS